MIENTLSDSKKFYYRRMIVVTIPIVIQNMMNIGLNLVDTVMIGRLGEVQLAATGSANQIFNIFNSFLFGFYSGAGVFAAQYFGAENLKKIRRIVGFDYCLGTGIALAFFAVVQIMPDQLIGIFTDEPSVVSEGVKYIDIVSYSYLATALSFAISYNSRIVQRLKWPTIINASAVFMKVILNYVFIYGPVQAGVKGAGYATLIARIYELIMLVIYVLIDKNHPFRTNIKEIFVWDGVLYKAVCKKAIPVLTSEVGWSLGITLVFATYGRLGSSALAVIQVAGATVLIFQGVIFGFGNGASVVIGETLGRKEVEEAVEHSYRTLKLALIMIIVMVAGSIAIMKPVATMYNFKAETTSLLYESITIYTFTMIPRMLAYILQCAILRAGGDTFFCMVTELLSNLGIELVMANIAVSLLGWDLPAAIALASLGNIFKMTANYLRFRSRKWINIVI